METLTVYRPQTTAQAGLHNHTSFPLRAARGMVWAVVGGGILWCLIGSALWLGFH